MWDPVGQRHLLWGYIKELRQVGAPGRELGQGHGIALGRPIALSGRVAVGSNQAARQGPTRCVAQAIPPRCLPLLLLNRFSL
jgi:hypothetical protein